MAHDHSWDLWTRHCPPKSYFLKKMYTKRDFLKKMYTKSNFLKKMYTKSYVLKKMYTKSDFLKENVQNTDETTLYVKLSNKTGCPKVSLQ